MKVLLLNRHEVAQLLPMPECVEVMAGALASLARGEVLMPLRPVMRLPESRGALGMMPAYWPQTQAMGLKALAIFPHDVDKPQDSHQGAVLLFESVRGALLAIMEAGAITALRTAAVSAVATRLLAREDAHDLALLGAGRLAGTHLEAMMLVREIKQVRVWSRNFEHARSFAQSAGSDYGIPITPVADAQAAVAQADLICTLTAARDPVLRGEWLGAGAHLNAVGASTPNARELDTAAVQRSSLFVDWRESALYEAGDFLIPQSEGAVTVDHIHGEIGAVLLKQVAGRQSQEEITLFKSLGLAIEDLAAAHHIYHKATRVELGTWVEM